MIHAHDGSAVLETYIETIGSNEPNNQPAIGALDGYDPMRASLLIGDACRLLLRGRDEAADTRLGEVCDRMSFWYLNDDPLVQGLGSVAGHLISIAEMLGDRNNPDALNIYQEEVYNQAVDESWTATLVLRPGDKSGDEAAVLTGSRTHNNMLGALTHTGISTFNALLHHDCGSRRNARSNHDLLAIGAATDGRLVVRRAQLKRHCVGLHEGEYEAGVRAENQRVMDRYSSELIIISEECDLVQMPEVGVKSSGHLSNLLHNEKDGTISRKDAGTLEEVRRGLERVILEPEPARRGRAYPRRLQPYDPATRGRLYLPSALSAAA